MKQFRKGFCLLGFYWIAAALAAEPIKLHPENPHYFLFRGKPAVLITSGEHYGAVLNLDFDYIPYLDELAARGFNLTRTFAGTYREIPGSFNIRDNTLAPKPNRYIAPWARSDTPGYFDGGNKFDLNKWDEEYFKRLKDFVAEAGKRGVVVEFVLFCPNYDEKLWQASPMNAANNVNGIGKVGLKEPYALKEQALTAAQDAFARKVVGELKDFDNLYYEICNEPYFGGVTLDWQAHIASVIVDTEANFPHKHLIAQNIANGSAKIDKPNPAVSIFNFHYARPPKAVEINYGLNKAIGFDESGFRGSTDRPYRTEAWDFILAGGAVYSNLDYSYTPQAENGTAAISAPGGGGPALRAQLKILKDFIHGFDFVKMAPAAGVVKGGVPPGASARALAEPGKAYAIYIHTNSAEPFAARWTGQIEARHSEDYSFHTFCDDGARLWVNGQLLIDQWKERGGKEDKAVIKLEAGKKYDLKMEYFQNTGGAAAKLFWSSASQKKEIVPKSQLHLADGSGNGLKGEYFEDREFTKLKLARTDATVNFEWSASPFELKPALFDLTLDLPAGNYRAEWFNPLDGKIEKTEDFKHDGGNKALTSPPYAGEIALRIVGR